jgi:hypothetical protein
MESNLISKTGNFIADNKKPLLYVGGAIAIVIIGFAIVNRLKSGIGGFLKNNSVGATDFTPIEVDNTKATISDTVANNYANQLFNSMKDAGTDTDMITSVLNKLQKKDDFLKVYNAYGRKSYYLYGEPTLGAYLFGYKDLDLVEWFNKEVGYSNLQTYNLIKKTVTNAGLTI